MAGSKKKSTCSDCGAGFQSNNSLKVHYFSKHYWDKARDAHTCSKCNATFTSLMAHRFHYMNNHFSIPDGEAPESMKMPYPEYAKVQQQMSEMQKELEVLRTKLAEKDSVVLPDGEEIVVEQEEKPWEKLYLEDAFLSILEKCNLRCTHCYLRDYIKVTDASDWMTMMDTLKGVGIKKVVLFGGEPTMHPNFFDIVHYASSSFRHVSIQSNGINKSALAKAAAFSNVNAVISFEDWEPNKHNAVRARVPSDGTGKREGKRVERFDAYGMAYDTLKHIPNSTLRGTIYSNNDVLKMAVMAEMAQANSMFFPFIPTQGAAGIQNLAPNGRKLLQDYKNLFMFDEQSVMMHRCEFPTYYMFRMVQWKGRIDAGTASDEEINKYYSWKTSFAKRGRICLPYNERILTVQDGEYKVERIGDLVENKPKNCMVVSLNARTQKTEIKRVKNFYDNGKKRVLNIMTRYRKEINLTDEHPVLTVGGAGELIWKQSKELCLGDLLVCTNKIPSLATKCVDHELLWLEGIYVAEGSSYKHKENKNGYQVNFTNHNPEIQKRIISILDKCGFKARVNKRGSDVISYGVRIFQWAQRFGGKAPHKSFIQSRLSLPGCCIRSMLDGYHAGDGHYRRPEPGRNEHIKRRYYTTISTYLVEQLFLAHLVLGDYCSVEYQGKKGLAKHDCYAIYAMEKSSYFNNTFPLSLLKQLRRDVPAKRKNGNKNAGIGGDVFSRLTGLDKRILVNVEQKKQKLARRETFTKIIQAFDATPQQDLSWMKTLLGSDLRFLEVLSIREKEEERVFDLEVEDNHNYLHVDSGVFLHNCGAGNHRAYVDGEGEVYPCHFLWEEKFKCGNLLKNDISDILGNLKAFNKKIYNLERGGNCATCNVNGLCGGGGACQYIHKGVRTGDTCPIAQGRHDSNEIKPAYLQKPLLAIRRI